MEWHSLLAAFKPPIDHPFPILPQLILPGYYQPRLLIMVLKLIGFLKNEDQDYDQARRTLLHGKDEASRLSFSYDLTDVVHRDVFGLGDRTSSLQNMKANAECAKDSVAPFYREVKAQAVDDGISKASIEAKTFLEASCNRLISYFTPKDINSCIISSENTRIFCSIMIALVVVAYSNLPLHVVRSKSTITSRPLYVLLVTDLMIVILRLHITKQNPIKMPVEKPESRHGDGNNWDEAVKVLEWGLVLYQTLHRLQFLYSDCCLWVFCYIALFNLKYWILDSLRCITQNLAVILKIFVVFFLFSKFVGLVHDDI